MNRHIGHAKALCKDFISWQGEDGGVDRKACPYMTDKYRPGSSSIEVPFMARALYKMYDSIYADKYKEAANRYSRFFIDSIDGVVVSWKLGLALECSYLYAKHNPDKNEEMIWKGRQLYEWLQHWRTDVGCYFMCGYTHKNWEHVPDVGFSDDLNHAGRGLIRYYELTKDPGAIKDAVGLSNYFLNDIQEGTMVGVWHPSLGTWAIGPWAMAGFEHFDWLPANQAGWGWSAFGCADFLMDVYGIIDNKAMKDKIASRSVESAKWFFNTCQFEDGGMGMIGRDDEWLGMAAAAVMYYKKLRITGLLSAEDLTYFKPKVRKTWNWLMQHTNLNQIPEAGYIPVTGKSKLYPGNNLIWLLAWTAETLAGEEPK